MEMEIKVSIIIPVYNAEKYIEECLKSVVEQSLKEIEIIIVDDGSTDNSAKIIETYVRRDKRIRYFYQENSGIAKTRAFGFKQARGKYIGWVDNDDFADSDMFYLLYKTAEEKKSDLVICNYRFYPEKIANKEKWFKEYRGIKDWYFIERNTHPWNKLVRKDLCDKIDFYETLLEYSDSVYVKAILHSQNPVTLNKELYNYRVGQSSVSNGYKGKCSYFENIAVTTKKQINFLQGTGKENSNEMQEYFNYRYIYSLLQLIIVSAYNNNYSLFFKAKSELESIKYKKNNLLWRIMRKNHGLTKAFVACYVIPNSYMVARIVTKRVYK